MDNDQGNFCVKMVQSADKVKCSTLE